MAARGLTLAQLKRTAPPTLSPGETAPWLGVSRSTFYESIKNGTCPVKVIRVQSRIRVLTSSLIQLLESGDGDAPAA
jgi:predicted DNA-binding transcriptional regulator AlpA